jgi:FMN phosphatase YigB (HAD superfamily)
MLTNIKVVVLDAFNTIIKREREYISEPYKIVRERATKPLINPMGRNYLLREYADLVGATFTDKEWRKIEGNLAIELDHIHAFDDAKEIIEELHKKNIIVTIGSNLAPEYGSVVLRIFTDLTKNLIDEYYFSYEMGTQKPQSGFYREIESNIVDYYDQMDEIYSDQFLMVGDNYINDYVAPKRMGWNALHLDRNNEYPPHEHRIYNLRDILERI